MKFRASYGSLANQALDNGWHAYLSTYGTGQTGYLMDGQKVQYALPGALVSNIVTWEKVTQWDLGLDFSVLRNRLKGTFDYFQRATTGMLGPGKLLPGILGVSEPEENAADMVTRGWELSLTWNDQLENGLHYSLGFNLSDTQAKSRGMTIRPNLCRVLIMRERQLVRFGDMNLHSSNRRKK